MKARIGLFVAIFAFAAAQSEGSDFDDDRG